MISHSLLPAWTSFFSPDSFGWTILDLAVKATALIVLAALSTLVFGLASAALRHRIWAMLFVALLLLPVFGIALPRWDWKVIPQGWQVPSHPALAIQPSTNPGVRQPIASAAPIQPKKVQAVPPPVTPRAASPSDSIALPVHKGDEFPEVVTRPATLEMDTTSHVESGRASVPWLAVGWLSGVGLALLPLVIGILANLRFRWCSPVLSGEWDGLLSGLSRQVGLRRKVSLLSAGPQQMPMTFGTWRPCVVLPADASDWSVERREIVLLHELSHIARHDVPLQMVARLACAVYWFHPLAWWALRQMRVEREHACDDHVLRTGQAAPDYAAQLLEIARAHSCSSVLLNAALSMARPSQLEGRLLAVLDEHRSRRPLGAISTASTATIALALVMTLSTVRPTLEAQSSSRAPNGESATAQKTDKPSARELTITGVVLSPDGKPAAGATIEAIANDGGTAWIHAFPGDPGIEHYQTQTDDTGHFRMGIPRDISRPRRFLSVLASDGSHRVATAHVDPRLTHKELELKLAESKTVRIQVVDAAGNPVLGVEPWLKYIALQSGSHVQSLYHPLWHSIASGWPRFTRSDDKGMTSVVVPAAAKRLTLIVDDERVGAHELEVDVTKEPASVALKSPRFLSGRVIDAENGQPIAGTEVVMMEQPYHGVHTKPDGTFRVSSGTTIRTLFPEGESIIHVYPPFDSPNLFKAIEWKWPNEGIGDANLVIRLKRGQIVDGQVVEKRSGKPVVGASVWFDPQEKGNRFFTQSAKSRFSGSDMKYATDSLGHFRLPVLPGPGHLLVTAPTLDYVRQMLSLGERYYGKPGCERGYYDGVAKIRLAQGEHPEPFTIELERGVTLRRKVELPDGKAVKGHAHARSYLQFKNDINQSLPDIPIEDGLLELPGCDPAHPNLVFLVDHTGKFGATVSLTAAESESRPIVLQPCGQARFHFIDERGKAIPNYMPMPFVVVTPGAPATHHIEPNRPLWVDSLNWSWEKRTKTDADGRVTISGLLPGATYRLSYADKSGWTDGHEFVVRAGETSDVGEIALSRRL
jgi:beta-lactamase regulating signal transducer with metallopeptidase domain